MACEICKVQICAQEICLKCAELRKHVIIPEDAKQSEIFRNTEKQLLIMKQVLRIREILETNDKPGLS